MTPEQQLEFLARATEAEIAKYLGTQTRRERVRNRLSQAAFAEKAGIPLRTYKRFELTGAGTIETLVRVMRAMEHARGFFTLFPAPPAPTRPTVLERAKSLERAMVGQTQRKGPSDS
ncbi:hypothetical protein ACEPT7_28275 [Burkholderia ubonensis]|uniref:hypothetical protein n=1 Tax=Burkholderia ubonensis TaxID=101571 RepID=UPI00358E0736